MFVSTMLSPLYFHHFLSLSVLFSLSPYPPITWIRCHTTGKWNWHRCIGKFIVSVFPVTMFYCTCIYYIAIRFVICKIVSDITMFFPQLCIAGMWHMAKTTCLQYIFLHQIAAGIVFQYMIQIDLFFWTIKKIFW